MKALLKIWFTVLVLPSILMIILYLTDSILTFELATTIWNAMKNVDYFLWTRTTNILLITVAMILIVQVAKWIFKFITWNLGNNEE